MSGPTCSAVDGIRCKNIFSRFAGACQLHWCIFCLMWWVCLPACLQSVCRSVSRRLYILCWSELSRRRLLLAVSLAADHLTTPTVAGLPGLCENFRPTTSKSSPILRLLSSHWATSFVKTRVVGVANVGDSLRQLSSLQHRIYNLLGLSVHRSLEPHFRSLPNFHCMLPISVVTYCHGSVLYWWHCEHYVPSVYGWRHGQE